MLPFCDLLESAVAFRFFEDGYDAFGSLQVLNCILFIDHTIDFISLMNHCVVGYSLREDTLYSICIIYDHLRPETKLKQCK